MSAEKTPKITVVTPSYNQGLFLDEAMASVVTQQGEFRLEYIVMDGGSTDGSVDIIRKYDRMLKERAGRLGCGSIEFRWVSEPDEGQTDAIRKGFESSTGEILAWLNSDDVYLPGTLEKVAGLFSRDPGADVFYGKSRYIDESGNPVGEYPTEPFDSDRLAESNVIAQPSAFFSRDIYFDLGGVDTGLNYVMDYDLWIRMALRARMVYVTEELSCYRLHGESKTVAVNHALGSERETLRVVRKYYGYAPLNRVFGYGALRVRSLLPGWLARLRPLAFPVEALFSLALYLGMNRGFRARDLRSLGVARIRKAVTGRRL